MINLKETIYYTDATRSDVQIKKIYISDLSVTDINIGDDSFKQLSIYTNNNKTKIIFKEINRKVIKGSMSTSYNTYECLLSNDLVELAKHSLGIINTKYELNLKELDIEYNENNDKIFSIIEKGHMSSSELGWGW